MPASPIRVEGCALTAAASLFSSIQNAHHRIGISHGPSLEESESARRLVHKVGEPTIG